MTSKLNVQTHTNI